MASGVPYGQAGVHLGSAAVNWVTDTIKVLLTGSGYTPDKDTHAFRSSITDEIAAAGYPAGGLTIPNRTRSYNAGTDMTVLDGDDLSFGAMTANPRWGVIYKSRGGAASADELIGYVDFVTVQNVISGYLNINWSASGIVLLEAVG
jgi:hypothetical protein